MYIEELLQELKITIINLQESIDGLTKGSSHELKRNTLIKEYDRGADELLTTSEVGKLLKCNREFVRKLIEAGLLPYMMLGSRKIRVSAVNEFLKKYERWDLSDPYNPKPIDSKLGG